MLVDSLNNPNLDVICAGMELPDAQDLLGNVSNGVKLSSIPSSGVTNFLPENKTLTTSIDLNSNSTEVDRGVKRKLAYDPDAYINPNVIQEDGDEDEDEDDCEDGEINDV